MRVTLNSNRDLRSVLDALSAMNVVMGTDSFRDEANKIAGDKAEQAKGDNAKFSRAISGITNFTPSQITESLRQSPFVGKFIDKLLARGEKGRRGGVIVAKDIEDAQRLFEEKTGRELGDDVLKSVKRDRRHARVQKWFGNSKVVDADGKPMVVIGTGDFTSFDQPSWETTQNLLRFLCRKLTIGSIFVSRKPN